ncbi:Voltage-dependent calcium channel gamma-5 subunit [Branchiostoma belcheri]|nr:Voltage-dependent calcium channel gamma-5 subunit [Branchiostoma belcheri]
MLMPGAEDGQCLGRVIRRWILQEDREYRSTLGGRAAAVRSYVNSARLNEGDTRSYKIECTNGIKPLNRGEASEMAQCGKRPLMLVTTVCSTASFALLAIAMGTDFWLFSREAMFTPRPNGTDKLAANSGLWNECIKRQGGFGHMMCMPRGETHCWLDSSVSATLQVAMFGPTADGTITGTWRGKWGLVICVIDPNSKPGEIIFAISPPKSAATVPRAHKADINLPWSTGLMIAASPLMVQKTAGDVRRDTDTGVDDDGQIVLLTQAASAMLAPPKETIIIWRRQHGKSLLYNTSSEPLFSRSAMALTFVTGNIDMLVTDTLTTAVHMQI